MAAEYKEEGGRRKGGHAFATVFFAKGAATHYTGA
jgi:hypothetical protein